MTRNPPETPLGLDVHSLERDLRAHVKGEVRFDDGSRALYATDASNYRQVPIAVVIPLDVDDVVATVEVCHRHDAPVLSRGGGTSLCGQSCNVAVMIDFTKHLHRVLEIDVQGRTALVEPGCVLDDLREQAGEHGLTFAPDPATHTHNTLGGMIGNNSCGPHSVMGGETVHNVLALEILTYDGLRTWVGGPGTDERLLAQGGRAAQIAQELRSLAERHAGRIREKFPPIPRRVSGYNLPALLPENGFDIAKSLVGSEGTCVVVLQARLRLLPNPPCRSLVVLGYDSVADAADDVMAVMDCGPIALEGMDDRLVEDIRQSHIHVDYVDLLPEGKGWLIVEFGGGTPDEAKARARKLTDRLRGRTKPPSIKLVDDATQEQHIWKVRESGLGATAHVPGKPITWEGWEDSSVPPENLGKYLRELRALFDRHGYGCDLYGHFGQGCVHTRIDFDLETQPGIEKFRRFLHEAAQLVVSLGGSVSGEHGDGQSKAELLPIMFGPELVRAFEEFKAIWDPRNRMNPGKVVHPYRPDENLRLGTAYAPRPVETRMFFADDRGDFGRTVLRCVGVGECRKRDGTMCPSYKATLEEKHSTRGRAHLLFEMLNGERDGGVLKQGWREEAVKEALDLCLSCKACKHECPVKVDMAAYKAEFLSHYYEHHPRPLSAATFGFIDRWARLAAVAPGAANYLTQHEPFSGWIKRAAGIAAQRRLPAFAAKTFTASFREEPLAGSRGEVLLWPDTFNNHFHPQVAHDAVEVLRRAGWRVRLPRASVCCGRPLYEAGYLDEARRYLERTLVVLADEIRAGIPVVVLEPACLSVFREEMPMMLPHHEQAKRLRQQSFLFADFLHAHAAGLEVRPLRRQALVHLHCHHKSVLGTDGEHEWLRRLQLDVQEPDTGCCGMAGSFGFEAGKYDVSMRCGERALLPAVREAGGEQLVLADGYSCREQIAQGTGRRALHLAQVLRMALEGAQDE
ncbi:FAD-binding and (Fe-S)-binding domain-containing protein [Ramlibacter humi]|uniref:FAD-binding oxidoreductase n=1 Tax=Ramlibacter humi TaxID=2530451 RepID=A0A4Z0BD54_9BURK|nr:FAD-binding and (Fe-S)-binding domain-containing protein [Ramlibacter humi]TFY97192.1 FAD-binding oxidoreductase [Ramlibacter humi]